MCNNDADGVRIVLNERRGSIYGDGFFYVTDVQAEMRGGSPTRFDNGLAHSTLESYGLDGYFVFARRKGRKVVVALPRSDGRTFQASHRAPDLDLRCGHRGARRIADDTRSGANRCLNDSKSKEQKKKYSRRSTLRDSTGAIIAQSASGTEWNHVIWRFPPNQRSADQLAAKPLSLPKPGRNSPPTGMKTETNTIVVIGLPSYTAEEIS